MQGRATAMARAMVGGVSALMAAVSDAARRWVQSGDVTVLGVLVAVAVVLLLLIVVPKGRRY